MIQMISSDFFLLPWEQNANLSPCFMKPSIIYNLYETTQSLLPNTLPPFYSSDTSDTFLPLNFHTCYYLCSNSLLPDHRMLGSLLTFSPWFYYDFLSSVIPSQLSNVASQPRTMSPNSSHLHNSSQSILTDSLPACFIFFVIFVFFCLYMPFP